MRPRSQVQEGQRYWDQRVCEPSLQSEQSKRGEGTTTTESRVGDVMQRDVAVVEADRVQATGPGAGQPSSTHRPGRACRRAIVGIVSESDLLTRAVHDARSPRAVRLFGGRRRARRADGVPAGQLMTSPGRHGLAHRHDRPGRRSGAEFTCAAASVIESDGEVVGMLSRGDPLRTFLQTDADMQAAVEVTVYDGLTTLTG